MIKKIQLNPNNANAYANRGSMYGGLMNFVKEVEDYNEAIIIDSNNSNYYLNRGFGYFWLKNYTQAIEDFNKTIELDSDVYASMAYGKRGESNFELKNYEQAVTDYTKSIQLCSKLEIYFEMKISYFGRGICYQMLGDIEKKKHSQTMQK